MIWAALLSDNRCLALRGHGLARGKRITLLAGHAKEAKMTKTILTATLIAMLAAAPAMARDALNQNKHITDSLVAGKAADTIRNTCSSITAKMFTALSKLSDLEDYARAQGYSEAEVKAFLKDKTEKARIKALATAYLKAAGAVEGDEESYCKAGRDEIAKGTLAGSLLRSWK
jgi:Family of unknown function (DUF5333)